MTAMRMRPSRAARAAALALLLVVPVAGAQDVRTVEFARQLRDTLPLAVRVDYGAGTIVVHGTEQPLLYQVQLAYDPRRAEPVYRYEPASRTLHVGARRGDGGEDGGPRTARDLRLDLARSVPVDLALELGSADADLDLGGMRLRRVAITSATSSATLHFDAPNQVAMERLDVEVGASSLRARGLANSRAREMRVQVEVGGADLDFGGEWTADMELDVEVTVGSATVRVPADVGVRVETRSTLGSFDGEGLVERDGAWYSANWDTAPHKLHIRGRTMLGKLQVTRGPA